MKIVLDIIEERIKAVLDEIKSHENKNTNGFAYDLGSFEELISLRDRIKLLSKE